MKFPNERRELVGDWTKLALLAAPFILIRLVPLITGHFAITRPASAQTANADDDRVIIIMIAIHSLARFVCLFAVFERPKESPARKWLWSARLTGNRSG